MAGKTKCLSLVKGRRIRITRLDGCGRPVYGDDATVVSEGFISVAFTANTTESDEISVTNAAGKVCVYEAPETTLTGYSIEIQFCAVDPDLFSLTTGQPVITDVNGDSIGLDIDTKTSLVAGGFALELWAGSAAGDACSTEGAQGSYGYLLVPFLKGGIVGDFTVENGAVTFTITGASTRDGNAWGVGPYNDIQINPAGGLPGPMYRPIGPTVALRTMLTDVNPPAPACGSRPLLDPLADPITAITAVVAPGSMDVDFTTTPNDIDAGVWYEFGDGTWDFVPATAQGDATHTYLVAGAYTVRASTNGTWVTKVVTVPGA